MPRFSLLSSLSWFVVRILLLPHVVFLHSPEYVFEEARA